MELQKILEIALPIAGVILLVLFLALCCKYVRCCKGCVNCCFFGDFRCQDCCLRQSVKQTGSKDDTPAGFEKDIEKEVTFLDLSPQQAVKSEVQSLCC